MTLAAITQRYEWSCHYLALTLVVPLTINRQKLLMVMDARIDEDARR